MEANIEGRPIFGTSRPPGGEPKIEVFGTQEGDVLIQPYSGGFGYGMLRANVVPLRKIKYRINFIFTDRVPARRGRREIPERKPTRTQSEAKNHVKVANIFLRQAGLELIPDDSAEVALRAGNNQIGLAVLDPRVVTATRATIGSPPAVEPGHFDVKVNDQSMTFHASVIGDSLRAVRVNARNEVIVFAYSCTDRRRRCTCGHRRESDKPRSQCQARSSQAIRQISQGQWNPVFVAHPKNRYSPGRTC